MFHDRLIDEADRTWFKDLLGTVVKENYNADYKKLKGEHANLIFGNFSDRKSIAKPYVEMTDRDKLTVAMADYLDDYNQMINLVLFASAISRIINQPFDSALLVGAGGSAI